VKSLKQILKNCKTIKIKGDIDIIIDNITFNSSDVKKGSLFIAIKGTRVDGHNFIESAEKSGAIAVICSNFPEKCNKNVTYILVKDTGYSLGIIASNFYDKPTEKLKLVGVTGTNGKTTIATLLFELYRSLGFKVGLFSTVCNRINDTIIPSTHTTPDPIALNCVFQKMVNQGCEYAFMEVSSHAIDQKRIAGLNFKGGVFTNITLDHLDYHKTFDKYIKAKKGFFDSLNKNAFALTNIDDKNGMVMLQNTKAKKYTYSLQTLADFKCRIIENQITGLQLNIDGVDVWFNLIGKYNAYNLLAIYATAILLGAEKNEVLEKLSALKAVEGRFDYIANSDKTIGIVDYAHTPDALKNILSTINDIRTGDEQVITVFGAGGDRDSSKRPIMAKIACELSDKVIITSDNPRSEDPEQIIFDILKGVDISNKKKVLVIENREQAINTACSLSKKGDIILIAGKGHEKYQEIKGVKHHFDDKEILYEYLINK